MIDFPDLSQYTYLDGEEALLVHMLKNNNVDDIVDRAESHLFTDATIGGIFEICKTYALGPGKGQVHTQDVLESLMAVGRDVSKAEPYLRALKSRDLTVVPSIDYAIETLKVLSTRRRAIMRLRHNLIRALDAKEDIKAVLSDAEEDLLGIETGDRGKLEVIMAKDVLKRRHDGLALRYITRPVYTGWEDFDKHLNHGFAPTKISIIAGRTSMGKSLFKTNVIVNMVTRKVGVVNICPEQGFDSEHDRIDALITGTSLRTLTRIRELQPGDEKFTRIKLHCEKIAAEWNYACVPTRSITVAGVQSAIRRARRAGMNPQVVFIDLFDRLEDVNVSRDRTATMSVKLGQIERIAQEENVHICLLVQINRGTEGRKDHRPTMADLRDCGNFEQDADLIMLLYREGYYNKAIEDNQLEIIIAKQRDGVAGLTYQFFVGSWENLSIFPQGEKRMEAQAKGGS